MNDHFFKLLDKILVEYYSSSTKDVRSFLVDWIESYKDHLRCTCVDRINMIIAITDGVSKLCLWQTMCCWIYNIVNGRMCRKYYSGGLRDILTRRRRFSSDVGIYVREVT